MERGRKNEKAKKAGKRRKWIWAGRIYEAIDNDVKEFLAKAEANKLRTQKHQPQRILWENRPRRRDIINLTPVVAGAVGGA